MYDDRLTVWGYGQTKHPPINKELYPYEEKLSQIIILRLI